MNDLLGASLLLFQLFICLYVIDNGRSYLPSKALVEVDRKSKQLQKSHWTPSPASSSSRTPSLNVYARERYENWAYEQKNSFDLYWNMLLISFAISIVYLFTRLDEVPTIDVRFGGFAEVEPASLFSDGDEEL